MKSMTGFGQATWQGKGCKITVEIRSVNQRFLEARFNLPREYLPWEAELREALQAAVARGKVDVNVTRSGPLVSEFAVEMNTPLARAYLDGWRKLQAALHLDGRIDVQFLAGRADLVRIVERRAEPTSERRRVQQVLRRALRAFNGEREREGRALARDMLRRAARLIALTRLMRTRVAAAEPELRARLEQRVAALITPGSVDPERLSQELAFLVIRSDITEELVRLETHLNALRRHGRSRTPAGKAIDFLLQEIHREVNTIASKSNDIGITDLTLEARGEIEKLREQVQNVE
jgi:uncharacterized protein (TIGR00255 family)